VRANPPTPPGAKLWGNKKATKPKAVTKHPTQLIEHL